MKITRLTVSGFKCFAEEQSFNFGDITYITGGNHVGKSSIADAIAFAFTGKLFSGDSTIDRLYSEESPDIRIAVNLLDEKGAAHELVRTRRKDKMAVAYDGYSVRQKDLDVMFGESDVFLSILNPTFFIERLGNDGQKLLQTHLPIIPHEAVLETLMDNERKLLEKQSLISPDVFIGHLREENRELNESLIALNGQRSLLQQQTDENRKNLAGLENRIISLDGKISALREKRENGINFKKLENKRAELILRRDEMLSDKPQTSPTAQVDLNISRAEADLAAIGQRQYASKYAPEIAKLEAELASEGEAYRRVYGVHQNIRPGVSCPTCLRKITEADNIEGMKAELNQAMQAIKQRGTDKRAQLQELIGMDKQALEVFEQFKKDDFEEANKRLADLQVKRNAIIAQSGKDEGSLTDINGQIAGVKADIELGGLTTEEKAELDALVEEREKLSVDYAAMKELSERPQPDIDGKAKGYEAAIRHNGDMIAAAINYLGARNEFTFKNLPLNKVAFSLYDIFKTTGEFKNVFRFTYGGRDYRKLSHSEKIFAGMEVSELIKALTGRNYPVFVDDSESVVSLAGIPSGQVFLSRVVPQQELTVAGTGLRREASPKPSEGVAA
jgi:dephospho-CoA kinase